jgi:hypothetical protein
MGGAASAIVKRREKQAKRDFIVTKNVSDGAEVALRRLGSVPQNHPGCTKRR